MDVVEKCFCECGDISKNVYLIKLIGLSFIVFNRKNIFKKLLKLFSKILKNFVFFIVVFICHTNVFLPYFYNCSKIVG